MKFRDKYKENNLNITPDANLKKDVLKRMEQEQEKSNAMGRNTRRYKWVAVFACIAIVVSCIGIRANKMFTDHVSLTDDILVAENYSKIYDRIEEIEHKEKITYGYESDDDYELVEDAASAPQTRDGAPAPKASINNAIAESPAEGYAYTGGGGDYISSKANVVGGNSDPAEFSGTNTQVDDVDEADIVKTDGKYIYTITNGILRVINAKGKKPYVLSKTELDKYAVVGNKNIKYYDIDMYVKDDKIAIVREGHSGKLNNEGKVTLDIQESIDIVVYNLDQNGKPKKINQVGQSGSHLSTRRIGNIIYLVTVKSVYNKYWHYKKEENNKKVKKDDPATFVPCTYIDGEKNPLKCEDIFIEKDAKDAEYLVISTLDIENPKEFCETKTILGSGTELYSSTENLYVALNDDDKSQTKFTRIALDGKNIEIKASGKVKGELLNQFSMDEYNGYFRVVTTRYDKDKSENALYILDKNLDVVSSIEELAKDEEVYSVRFDGDIGYFVTYRETDPLFTVDLSNVKKPKILSALKIPGFSEYLHLYSEDLLFGLGIETDVTEEDDDWEEPLKLSMFDVSNKKDVTERDKLVLSNWYDDSEALYNHKAIFIAPEKNLIGFPTYEKYKIFEYTKEKGFKRVANIDFDEIYAKDDYYDWDESTRGLYIGDTFYLINKYGLLAYSMDTYEIIKRIDFKDKEINIYKDYFTNTSEIYYGY